jgi:hypothetical protein
VLYLLPILPPTVDTLPLQSLSPTLFPLEEAIHLALRDRTRHSGVDITHSMEPRSHLSSEQVKILSMQSLNDSLNIESNVSLLFAGNGPSCGTY